MEYLGWANFQMQGIKQGRETSSGFLSIALKRKHFFWQRKNKIGCFCFLFPIYLPSNLKNKAFEFTDKHVLLGGKSK